ncbi:MAG: hypothetical protein R2789_15635 [Microthrixaceae bacterium]
MHRRRLLRKVRKNSVVLGDRFSENLEDLAVDWVVDAGHRLPDGTLSGALVAATGHRPRSAGDCVARAIGGRSGPRGPAPRARARLSNSPPGRGRDHETDSGVMNGPPAWRWVSGRAIRSRELSEPRALGAGSPRGDGEVTMAGCPTV